MRDLYSAVKMLISLVQAARTNGTTNGTGCDISGYDSACAIFRTGAATDGSHAMKLQESDDNSAWNDVAAADQVGSNPTATSADGSKTFKIGYIGKKRYLRPVIVTSGATTGAIIGADVLVGNAGKQPA